MLSCKNLTVELSPGGQRILNAANGTFKTRALNAIIGPSGCGKTTLVKAMLGILPRTGEVKLGDVTIGDSAELRGRVGFAPQFSIAQPQLTVGEAVRSALDLVVCENTVKSARYGEILKRIGLAEHADKRVDSLSGGQLRRIGLGLELASDPACMVCDEVTSGLDPRSEDAILEMLQGLRDEDDKTFYCIIHNLAKLDYFDWITVVNEGEIVFQGSLEELNRYFDIPDALHLYDRLSEQTIKHWRERWSARAQSFAAERVDEPIPETPPLPSTWSQIQTLLQRRLRLFARDSGYWMLTLGITLGFPILVAIFALNGLPELPAPDLAAELGIIEQLEADLRYSIAAMETASLVTGLILFQVILLTLMGSNNGAREIAAERELYEKERFSGLRPVAYAISKLLFVSAIAIIQGAYMTAFVKIVCAFPGPWLPQMGILVMCCVAMTAICLGFSAIFKSPDKASLVSIYLVGFQLPLSGIVLALPPLLVWVCRPLINAYWAWSGYFSSMIDTRYYDAYRVGSAEPIPVPELAIVVLLFHFVVGAGMVFWGCVRKQWN